METFVMFAIKRTISKFATHLLVKKCIKLKSMNLMNLPARAIRNKNSDWSITLPSNGILFHTKMIPELNATSFLRQFWKSLTMNLDLPVKIILSAYNNFKILVLGKCSAINVSDEQFLSKFSDYFGEIGTLKNTHHIDVKDNVTLA